MIAIWPSVYIHPYGIYDPHTRTIQESDSILEKQYRSAKSLMRFKLHHSEERLKLTGYYVVLFYRRIKQARNSGQIDNQTSLSFQANLFFP
jgi:hypothetical protein